MITGADAEKMIESLDLGLFANAFSQTSDYDRKSLLAAQRVVRRLRGDYVYLEIGSYLGGTIQPHLVDPRCKRIYSIDKRPPQQPDERSAAIEYQDNSSARMLQILGAIAPDQVSKITCFDNDARDINPALVSPRPDLCFIDGEHTAKAASADFEFCMSVCAPGAVICFHDAHIVHKGLKQIKRDLASRSVKFKAGILGLVYVIALGDTPVFEDECIKALMRNEDAFFLTSGARLFVETHCGDAVKALLRPLAKLITRKDVWGSTYAKQ
jgi:hypothetical protein